jgi:hypothetical protein
MCAVGLPNIGLVDVAVVCSQCPRLPQTISPRPTLSLLLDSLPPRSTRPIRPLHELSLGIYVPVLCSEPLYRAREQCTFQLLMPLPLGTFPCMASYAIAPTFPCYLLGAPIGLFRTRIAFKVTPQCSAEVYHFIPVNIMTRSSFSTTCYRRG